MPTSLSRCSPTPGLAGSDPLPYKEIGADELDMIGFTLSEIWRLTAVAVLVLQPQFVIFVV